MKLLYYSWDEVIENDIYETLIKLGIDVDTLKFPIKDKLNDIPFTMKLSSILDSTQYDYIFTTNYLPIISKVAYAYGIKYISWLFDSNSLYLYSNSIFNDTNYIFTYDYCDYKMLTNLGVKKAFYMPLAVNTSKINKLIVNSDKKYKFDVSFLGNLYANATQYDQIKNMPEYYRGYFDSIIDTQMNFYGIDLASILVTDEIYAKISNLITFNLEDELFITPREIFITFLQAKVTSIERTMLLKSIADEFSLTHFAATQSPSLINVDFGGYADYNTQMPLVFNSSKINLNITLRTIKTAIPLRCMDIMGAGGFLLSNYQQELAELFENGVDMVMYESHEDALNKIDYYLSHEKEREEIAVNGKRKIEEDFTYQKAFNKIFRECEEK